MYVHHQEAYSSMYSLLKYTSMRVEWVVPSLLTRVEVDPVNFNLFHHPLLSTYLFSSSSQAKLRLGLHLKARLCPDCCLSSS